MTIWKSVLAAAAVALASSTSAMAQRTDLVLGVVLEPPHLDPTAGAAAAIDAAVEMLAAAELKITRVQAAYGEQMRLPPEDRPEGKP